MHRSGLFLALCLWMAAPSVEAESLRIDRVARKIREVEARRDAEMSVYESQLQTLQQQRNSYQIPYGRDVDPFYRTEMMNARNEVSSQISRLMNEKNQASSRYSQEINRINMESRWQHLSRYQRTVSVNGHPIPDWADSYRFIDGRMEFQPSAPPAELARRRATAKPQYDSLFEANKKDYVAKTASFEKLWVTDWLVSVETKYANFVRDSEKALNETSNEILRERVKRRYEPMKEKIATNLLEYRRQLDAELAERNSVPEQKIRKLLDECMDADYTVDAAREDLGIILGEDLARHDKVKNSIFRSWSNGNGGNGGLKAEWDAFPDVASLVRAEIKAFEAFDRAKADIRQWQVDKMSALTTRYASWFAPVKAEHEEWVTKERNLIAAEVYPHVREPVTDLFVKERLRRERFMEKIQKEMDAERFREAREILPILAKVDEAYDGSSEGLSTLIPKLKREFEILSSSWDRYFTPMFDQWMLEGGEEPARLSYKGAEVFIAAERGRYPLRYQPEGCEYIYEVQLHNALNVVIHVDAAKKETVVSEVKARQSFACHKNQALVLAFGFKVLSGATPEVARVADADSIAAKALAIVDGKIQKVVETPDPLLKLTNAAARMDGTLILQLKDPRSRWVDDFALTWDAGSQSVEILEVSEILEPKEVWVP